MTTTAVLAGPQGSGKGIISEALRDRLGCTHVVDEWWPGQPVTPGALHVTHASMGLQLEGAKVYGVDEAWQIVGTA